MKAKYMDLATDLIYHIRQTNIFHLIKKKKKSLGILNVCGGKRLSSDSEMMQCGGFVSMVTKFKHKTEISPDETHIVQKTDMKSSTKKNQ